jgi:hypothetical protein
MQALLGFTSEGRWLLPEVVGRLADGAPKLSDAAKTELGATMRRFLPDAPLTWMIGLGADAVAAELAAEADRTGSGPES